MTVKKKKLMATSVFSCASCTAGSASEHRYGIYRAAGQAWMDQREDYTEDHPVDTVACNVDLTVYVHARGARASEQVAGQSLE